jgi:hypothetical protein
MACRLTRSLIEYDSGPSADGEARRWARVYGVDDQWHVMTYGFDVGAPVYRHDITRREASAIARQWCNSGRRAAALGDGGKGSG